ncbi:hypothetical protein [Bdellovibrio sp. HCB337]|uniref:hypothetical protein n=1 Tax=Bdellovibrio sp. HCB337 TaxID=3394358 RepID=UPI0039A5AD8A
MKKLVLITTMIILPFTSQALEGRESGGGDSYALEFVQIAQQVTQHLKFQRSKLIDIKKLDEAITKTTIESTDKKLVLNGAAKDAINYPAEGRIVINRQSWRGMSRDVKPALVLHEYLGIMRVNDATYELSKQVLEAFAYSGTPQENFRAGALATTKVLPIVQDRYTGDTGVGFISLAETRTDKKSENNIVLIVGLPDGTSDTYKHSVEIDLDEIDTVTLSGTDLVVKGLRYDWNNDASSSATVSIQIKKNAGSDKYLSKLVVR